MSTIPTALPTDPQQNPVATPAPPSQAPVSGSQPGLGTRILGALSGGMNEKEYNYDQNGKMQVTDGPQRKPGEMFKSMLQGMLTGLAGGAEANQEGVHGAAGAIGGAAKASLQRNQAIEQQKKQQAQQQFKDQQEAANTQDQQKLTQASLAKSNLDLSAAAFKLAESKVALTEDNQKQISELQSTVAKSGGKYEGFAKDFDSLMSTMGQDPNKQKELIAAHSAGTLQSVPILGQDKDGNPIVAGVEFYNVPQEWGSQKTTDPFTYQSTRVDPTSGKEVVVDNKIPAGAMSNHDKLLLQQHQVTGAITPKDAADNANKLKIVQMEQAGEDRRAAAKMSFEKAENGTISDDDHTQIVKGLVDASVDPKSLTSLARKNPAEYLSLKADAQRLDPTWTEEKFANQHNMVKEWTGAGKNARQMVNQDAALQGLSKLDKILSSLPNTTNSADLNRFIAAAAKRFNAPELASAEAIQTATSIEVANGLASGGTAPHKEELDRIAKDFDLNKGPEAVRANLHAQVSNMISRMEGGANQLHTELPGKINEDRHINISGAGQEALNHFGYDNPFNFGQLPSAKVLGSTTAPDWVLRDAMKKASNNPQQAHALLKQSGFTQ